MARFIGAPVIAECGGDNITEFDVRSVGMLCRRDGTGTNDGTAGGGSVGGGQGSGGGVINHNTARLRCRGGKPQTGRDS